MSIVLERVRLQSFKRFAESIEISGFSAGLNLFAAPNESGKSTVAEAIRVAFLERHRSSWADCLRPWGQGSAAPTVELDFSIGVTPCRLSKAFLTKKRCDLKFGSQVLDGTQAEDKLATLLGFRFAKKGASSDEDMGVPGLLWVRQGSSHELLDRVAYAGDHLRSALGDAMGELSSSKGDGLLRQVEAERNALLHASNGSPKGDYAQTLRQCADLEQEVTRIEQEIATYRNDVDQLATLSARHAREQTEKPWEAVSRKLAAAREALKEAQGLAERKFGADRHCEQALAQVQAARAVMEGFSKVEDECDSRRVACLRKREQAEAAEQDVKAQAQRYEAAVSAEQAAREVLARATRMADRAAKAEASGTAAAAEQAAREALNKAREANASLARLQAEAAAVQVDPALLKRLQETDILRREAQARLQAASTTVQFSLQAEARVELDGEVVRGELTRIFSRRGTIAIPSVGTIDVIPGGADLDALVAERDQQQATLDTLLLSANATSLVQVQLRATEYNRLKSQVDTAAALLKAHAPKGFAVLESALHLAESKHKAAAKALYDLPAEDAAAGALPDLATARTVADVAREALDIASASLSTARVAASAASAQHAGEQAELAAIEARIADPQWSQRQSAASIALTDALAQETAARATQAQLDAQLKAANLPLLEQDVKRLAASEKSLLSAHADRASQITRLTARLETTGGLGLEEELAEHTRQLDENKRRAEALTRRSRALDHLLGLLRTKRAELAQRLRAPLQKYLNHYLAILFPGATIEIEENFTPGKLTRLSSAGSESGDFNELSVGAREQMGIIARLAYADLLKEAGKPTLVILDDALVHTDDVRLDQMKRVLFDAAERHQILVFTCHPDAWSDIGVPIRQLA